MSKSEKIGGWASEDLGDWDAVSVEGPAALPAGVYRFEPAECAVEKTKTNKPMLKLTLSFVNAYGSDEKLKRKGFDNVVVSAETRFKVKQLCQCLQIEPPKNTGLEELESFKDRILDAPGGFVKLKHEAYDGKVNHKVERYLTEQDAEAMANGGAAAGEAPEEPRRRRGRAA